MSRDRDLPETLFRLALAIAGFAAIYFIWDSFSDDAFAAGVGLIVALQILLDD